MKANNATGLRRILEGLPTAELDKLLQEELQKKPQDEAAVKMILTILEERDASVPKERTQQDEAARERYHERMETLFCPEPKRNWVPVLKVASIVVVACILFVGLPLRAEAETFWEMLQQISSAVIEYFSGEGQLVERAYAFETENAGLHQIYDAVVELGITEPFVPMWLPEKKEISELKVTELPMMTSILAVFSDGSSEVVYKMSVYKGEPAHQFYKDDQYYDSYERNGTIFNITRNNERWAAVWTKDNIQCSIILDCQEETLRRILKSIYVMEDE